MADNPEKYQLVAIDEEPLLKPKQPAKKKKNKKKTRTYESLLAKPSVIAKIHDKIDKADNIPEPLKRKYKNIETDPLMLIVTNSPQDTAPEEFIEFFNVLLTSINPKFEDTDNKPVRNCFIGETKRFAILQLIDLECVWQLLKLSPVIYKDVKVYISRPKGFFVSHYQSGNYKLDENGNLINQDEGDQVKLYISNLPQYMKEIQVRKLAESFGPLKNLQMKMEFSMGESVPKGYCIVEYLNPLHAEEAYKKLQDLQVGDKLLKVKRVEVVREDTAVANRTAPTRELQTSFLLMFPKLRDPLVQGTLSIPVFCTSDSRVIQFLNMCTPEDLFEQDFYEQLKDDVVNECSKFGFIDNIEIVRPELRTGLCSPSVGKIFVRFSDTLDAKKARYRLNGRTYNNRTVIVSFYPEKKFESREYESRLD